MARNTCPICDAEILQNHDCADFDFSKLSIELEILGLSIELEPYELPAESASSHHVLRRNANSIGEKKRTAPLFLRM